MSLADYTIFVTENRDGSADVTVSIADDDHKFSLSPNGDTGRAEVSYDESLTWRGQIKVTEPDESVWKALMQSDEVTAYLEENDLTGIRRKR